MKSLLFILLFFVSFSAFSQQPTGSFAMPNASRGIRYNGLMANTELYFPIYDTMFTPLRQGAVTRRPQDTTAGNNIFYTWVGYKWTAIDIAGSGGTGGSGLRKVYSGLWLSNTNDSTIKSDSAAMAAYFLRRKDSGVNYVTPFQFANRSIPNLQQVTDGDGNNVTSNDLISTSALRLYDGTNEIFSVTNDGGQPVLDASTGSVLAGGITTGVINLSERGGTYNLGILLPNMPDNNQSRTIQLPKFQYDIREGYGRYWPVSVSGFIADTTGNIQINYLDTLYRSGDSLIVFKKNGTRWGIYSPTSTGTTGVSLVSVTTANGISGTVANASTTPAITLNLDATRWQTKAATKTTSDSVVALIPTNNNTLTNGAGYITSSSLTPYLQVSDSTKYSTKANATKQRDSVQANVAAEVTARTAADALKQNLVTLTTTGSTGSATFNQSTGALNIPSYTGGSGTALANLYTKDSSLNSPRTVTMGAYTMSFKGNKTIFDSTTTGTDYTRVGQLVNESFSAGSIPTGWTKGSGLTVSYTGSKATITGASSLGAPTGGANTAAYTSGLQYDTRRMPYGKIDLEMSIVAGTKSANAIAGFTTATLGSSILLQKGIFFDLSNGANSGRVALTSASPLTLPTFVTNGDSTSKANFSTGDTLILYVRQNEWSIVAGIKNKTTGQTTATYFYQQWAGSGGRWNLVFLNGTYVLTNFKATVNDRKGGVYFITDSQGAGSGNSQQSKRFPDLVFNGNPKYFSLWGLPSLSAKAFIDGGLPAELIADAAPSKVIVALGYNDISESYAALSTKTQVDSIVSPLQRAGVQVGIMGTVPRTLTTDVTNDSLQSLAATRGADFYDIRTALKYSAGNLNGQYKYTDNIHLNDSGAYRVAQVVIAKSGDSLLAEMASDTGVVAKMYGVQSTNQASANQLLTIAPNGTVQSIANNLPTPGSWLQNGNSIGGAPQIGSMRLSGVVRSDQYLMNVSGQGIQIGGNDSTSVNTSNANLQVTNFGASGTGYPQYFVPITGAGNIFISMSSANKTKTSQTGSVGGNNNTLLNNSITSSVTGSDNIGIGNYGWAGTTGSGNIGIGANGLKGITTASNIISIATRNSAGGSLPNASDYIQIGDMSSANGVAAVAGDIVIDPYQFGAASRFYVGGKVATIAKTILVSAPISSGTNIPGVGLSVSGGIATGVGEPGKLPFNFSLPTTTGSTQQSTIYTGTLIERTGVTVASATVAPLKAFDALLDMQSTVSAFLPPRMTTTQRDIISTGLLTATTTAIGSGYTNGLAVPLTFSGGGCTVQPVGYVLIPTGAVSGNPTITSRGSGCTSAPSATLTSGAGTGATFSFTIGVTEGATIYNTITHQTETWNATTWAH